MVSSSSWHGFPLKNLFSYFIIARSEINHKINNAPKIKKWLKIKESFDNLHKLL